MTEGPKYLPLVASMATQISAQVAARLCRHFPAVYGEALTVAEFVAVDVLDALIEDADFYAEDAVPLSRVRRLRGEFASRLPMDGDTPNGQ